MQFSNPGLAICIFLLKLTRDLPECQDPSKAKQVLWKTKVGLGPRWPCPWRTSYTYRSLAAVWLFKNLFQLWVLSCEQPPTTHITYVHVPHTLRFPQNLCHLFTVWLCCTSHWLFPYPSTSSTIHKHTPCNCQISVCHPSGLLFYPTMHPNSWILTAWVCSWYGTRMFKPLMNVSCLSLLFLFLPTGLCSLVSLSLSFHLLFPSVHQ